MEIVRNRRKMLDAMESNAKGNDNFAIKVISTTNVEGKSYIFKIKYERSKKKESNFLYFASYYLERLVITLINFFCNSIKF